MRFPLPNFLPPRERCASMAEACDAHAAFQDEKQVRPSAIQ